MSIKNKMLIYLTLLMVGMLSYWGEAIQAEYNIQQVEQLKGKKEILFQKQETLQDELQKEKDILFSIKMSEIPKSFELQTPKENLSVEAQIKKIAKEKNFKQKELLVKLAFCESSMNPLAVNYNTNGSSDYGLFQYNSIHKFGEKPLDIKWSTEKTIEWIRAGKLHAWNSSKKCWNK